MKMASSYYMKTKAILFDAPGKVSLGEVTLPEPGPGQLLLKTLFSCISPGTEMRCLQGKQAGADDWPFIPGYATSAEVIATGGGCELAEGTLVRCNGTQSADVTCQWGGHIAHQVVNESSVQVIPEGCDPLDASIARIAAIAYHGVALARPRSHEKVAVIGLGPIGQFAARCHHLAGAHVLGVDMDPRRVEILKNAGVEAVVTTGSLREALTPVFPGGVDILVDATGFAPVMREAVELMRPLPWTPEPGEGPKYIIQGSYADTFSMPYQEAFMNELEIRIPRDSTPGDLRAVMDFVARKRLLAKDLVSEVATPDKAAEIYSRLGEKGTPLLTVAFDWS